MNFFRVNVQAEGAYYRLNDGASLDVRLPSQDFGYLENYVGLPLDLGCRPEACQLLSDSQQPAHLSGKLVYAENLGAESNLFIEHGNNLQFIVKQPGGQILANGQQLKIALDMQQLHFFDPQTDLRLWPDAIL